MKLSNLSKIVTGAAALAASPGAGYEPSTIPARPGNRGADAALARGNLRGLLKSRPGSRNDLGGTTHASDGCRARIKERQDSDAIYTVVDASKDVCPKWIGDVIAECPGTDTLSPSENFVGSFSIPDDVLTSSLNPVLNGWVSAEGKGNKTIADCVAQKFDHIVHEFKDDPIYKVKLGLGIGIPAVLLAGLGAYGVSLCMKRRPAAPTP